MANRNTEHDRQQPAKSNGGLNALGIFVGTWSVELAFPTDPPGTMHGEVTFDWLEDGAFLMEHFGDSTWIIGPDDTTETYCALYHDARGVSRVYQMGLRDGVWKLWRDAPGFSQRFEGEFRDNAKTITARWERSRDGASWEHDFDLRYTKIR